MAENQLPVCSLESDKVFLSKQCRGGTTAWNNLMTDEGHPESSLSATPECMDKTHSRS